ncbi:MAG: ECF transporter S component, partial [Lachnospiraceae bacterium]|nr:ECF transporter S component [Lachnospiraceae bacterium]
MNKSNQAVVSAKSSRTLVFAGAISAIILIMAFTPLGFIPLPFIKMTIIHIPVILGAVLLGPKYGAFF